ncbi:hypothetical protein ABIF20_001563 [Bradyrhizobium japonicum]
MPVGPAVTDAEHEVGFQHGRIAIAVAGLQADHAGHQHVVVGDRAPPHQRRHDRHVGDLGEFHQQVRGVGVDDTATRDDQRPLGGIEHLQRLLDLLARRGGLVDRQRLIGLVVELDLGELHVERHVDQHRTRSARAHDVKGLAEHTRHQRRLAHGHSPFGHGLCDRLDIDGLEVFLVEPCARRLPGDAEDRNGIGDRRIEPGDHVGAGRPRRADADADIAGLRPRIALGHMRGALDMARENVADRPALLQRRVQRIDRGPGNAEGSRDALFLQNSHGSIDGSHLRHIGPRLSCVSERDHQACKMRSQRDRFYFPRCGNRRKTAAVSSG